MKIPFTKYHIFVLSEARVLEIKQNETKLDALISLASHFIPSIKQLKTALHEAKVGYAARGRRIVRRKLERAAHKVRERLRAA